MVPVGLGAEWQSARGVSFGMEWIYLLIGLVAGLVVGALLVRLRSGQAASELRVRIARLEQELLAEREKLQWAETAEEKLREAFTALASQSLSSNSQQFLTQAQRELKTLVDPLTQKLDTMDQQVRALESKREGAYGKLGEQLRTLGEAQSELQRTTVSLEQALKSPTARGRWGELQLRRVVELAGMQSHVDFEEQATTEEGRPDMLIRLPGDGILPVDAKASATAYLEAMESEGERRTTKLAEHARAMRTRIQDLSRKQYWAQFERAPDLVVMFVPFESALSAAFEKDPGLLEYGIEQRILVASPVTLLALLRAAAFGWQQQQVAENAQAIANEGRQLHERVVTFLSHLVTHGKTLGRSVEAYNSAIGSLRTRLMPSLNRFRDLSAATKELPDPEPIDRAPQLPLDESDG